MLGGLPRREVVTMVEVVVALKVLLREGGPDGVLQKPGKVRVLSTISVAVNSTSGRQVTFSPCR